MIERAPKLTSVRFMPRARSLIPQKRGHTAPWISRYLDKCQNVLPAYRPLLGQLDACTRESQLVVSLRSAISLNDWNKSIMLWKKLDFASQNPHTFQSFKELARKNGGYGPSELERIVNLLVSRDELAVKLWKHSTKPLLPMFVLPKLVEKKLKWGHPSFERRKQETRSLIGTLSRLATSSTQFQSLNTMVNVYLHNTSASYAEIKALFDALSPNLKPHLHFYVTRKLHTVNNRGDLAKLFLLFQQRKVPMGLKGMSTFLRALYSSSDHGARLIENHYREVRFSIGFYHFLISQLCKSKDEERVNWLFENVIFKLAKERPRHIPLVLHMLAIRTISFDGIQEVQTILAQMGLGEGISEPTWLLIFREFRFLGRPDKCLDTLRRTLEQGHKLSMPYVTEVLLMTAQNHNAHEFLETLRRLVPEIEAVLIELGINEALADVLPLSQTVSKGLSDFNAEGLKKLRLSPDVRAFPVFAIHNSWLSTVYQVALNNVDDLHAIERLYEKYEAYALRSKTAVTLTVPNQFVGKLSQIPGIHSIISAERVYRSALTNLRLRRPNDGRENTSALARLCSRLLRSKDGLKRALSLADLALGHEAIAVQGSSLVQIVQHLESSNPAHASMFRDWAGTQGADLPSAAAGARTAQAMS